MVTNGTSGNGADHLTRDYLAAERRHEAQQCVAACQDVQRLAASLSHAADLGLDLGVPLHLLHLARRRAAFLTRMFERKGK